MSESFEDKIKEYKQKSPKHLQNYKKIRALQNFAKAHADSKLWEELEVMIRMYMKGFLWPSSENLLDDILDHYKIDYTKWAVKDGWVKGQIFKGMKQKPGSVQLEFWFEDLEREVVETREKTPIYSMLERYKHIQPRVSDVRVCSNRILFSDDRRSGYIGDLFSQGDQENDRAVG